MKFLFIILFCFFPMAYADEPLGSEPQDVLSYHLSDDPEEVFQFVQTLLKEKCNTGKNPAACSTTSLLNKKCGSNNPHPLCLSKYGILSMAAQGFYPFLFFSERQSGQDFPPINLLPDSREFLLNQGRPGEFVDTSYTPPFVIDDDGNAVTGLYNSDTLFNNYPMPMKEGSYLQLLERDMKIACSIEDELRDPDYCLWIDPENRPKAR